MIVGIVGRRAPAGFSAAEILVVIAAIGVLAVLSMPTLISYWRASTVKAAAEELMAGLSSARQLAITRNRTVCFELAGGNRYRFWLGTCGGGTVWTGPGTGANGFYMVADGVTVTTTANPVFDRLGAAPTQATFTISNAQGLTRSVVVAASGRVTK